MKPSEKGHRCGGFSLMEILLVLSVMGILTSVGLSTAQVIFRWMSTTRSRQLFGELELSLKQYKVDNGYWPASMHGSEFGINRLSDDWKTELAPYLTGTADGEELVDGFGNTDIRIVLDYDGDQSCDPGDMPGLPVEYHGKPVWKQVAIYSLDEFGRLAVTNWDQHEQETE